jgi:NADPH-dependent F420 reductase
MAKQRTIGIVGGTGKEGSGLALRWAAAGHRVIIGSRDTARAAARAAELTSEAGASIEGGANETAVRDAEVVVLTVPYAAHGETLRALAPLCAGKLLVDVTVPLRPPKVTMVQLPPGQAAALEARAILDGAGVDVRVAAALHHVSFAYLHKLKHDLGHRSEAQVLVCADDRAAAEAVIELVSDLGLRGLDAGPLANAIAVESMTAVLLYLNKRYSVAGGTGIRITGIA